MQVLLWFFEGKTEGIERKRFLRLFWVRISAVEIQFPKENEIMLLFFLWKRQNVVLA